MSSGDVQGLLQKIGGLPGRLLLQPWLEVREESMLYLGMGFGEDRSGQGVEGSLSLAGSSPGYAYALIPFLGHCRIQTLSSSKPWQMHQK